MEIKSSVKTKSRSFPFYTKRSRRKTLCRFPRLALEKESNVTKKKKKSSQDNGNKGEKLAVASELLAVVNLFPPGQPVVDSLIIPKWCSLLPVEGMVCDLD